MADPPLLANLSTITCPQVSLFNYGLLIIFVFLYDSNTIKVCDYQ